MTLMNVFEIQDIRRVIFSYIYPVVIDAGCLNEVKRFTVNRFGSRTIRTKQSTTINKQVLYKYSPESCLFRFQ